ncbi:MAG TPA: NusG domain II-containing protein [Clostridia bacterium]|jgi:hypothetical protein|nr:NusG domain II-containing protein [Clostridia bacterium]HHY06456.1 NusG domain II-containing protein [Clostridia bacterium]
MTKTDQKLLLGLLIIGLLALAGHRFYFQSQTQSNQVIIKAKGEVVQTLTLRAGEPLQRLTIEGKKGQAIVETKGLKVRMLEAPCPDQICVQQGWIDSPRQTIICVPNEIVIYIDAEASLDGITG